MEDPVCTDTFQARRNDPGWNHYQDQHLASPYNQRPKLLEYCRLHKPNIIDAYCKRCGDCICIQCKYKAHKSHEVISLSEKGAHLKEQLETSLNELTEQIDQLKQNRENVEFAARKAQDQMNQHYRTVTSKLSEVLHKQNSVINEKKRKQMREITDKERRIYDTIQILERRKTDFLHQDVSSKVIEQCKKDLVAAASYQGERKESPSMSKQAFIQPAAPPIYSSEYLDHCERFILGYFGNKDVGATIKRKDTDEIDGSSHYSSYIPNVDYTTHWYPRSDSMSTNGTLRYNNPDEYATQYTADSVNSLKNLCGNDNKYEDASTIVPHDSMDAIYEEVVPQDNLSFPPNVHHERPASPSPAYVHHRNETDQSPPPPVENAYPRRKLPKLSKDLMSYTDRKTFHLKSISDVVIKEFSIWLCGWSKNVVGNNDTVLMNIDTESLKIQFKTKRTNRDAHLPTILVPFKELLLFANKGGHKIYCFNEKTHHITKVYEAASISIQAMCCTDKHIYIMDTKSNPCIRMLNSDFQPGNLSSVDDANTGNCGMDMCAVGNTIIVSTAKPMASVKALRQNQVVWQVNGYNHPELTLSFDPCSVTAFVTCDVLVADRGTDKIYFLSSDGRDLQVVQETGIKNPTRIRADKDEKWIVVIQKDGDEIRNYIIKDKKKIDKSNQNVPIPARQNYEPIPAPRNYEPIPAPRNYEPIPAPRNYELLPTMRQPVTGGNVGENGSGRLTQNMLHKLSKKLVNEKDLRDVALTGLGIKGTEVQRHISNNRDITVAAYNVLNDWFNAQSSKTEAYTKLNHALDITKKKMMKKTLS